MTGITAHVEGHYEVAKTSRATDPVGAPGGGRGEGGGVPWLGSLRAAEGTRGWARRPGLPTTCGCRARKRWGGASSPGSFVPGTPLTPSRSKNSGPIPKNNTGGRWKPFEVRGAHASYLATPPSAAQPAG